MLSVILLLVIATASDTLTCIFFFLNKVIANWKPSLPPLVSRTVVWILNKPTMYTSFADRYCPSSGRGIYCSLWETQAEGIGVGSFSTSSVMTGVY